MCYIGFDIGGSSVEAALVKNRQIIKSLTKETPGDFEGLLELIFEIKSELASGIAPDEISGIGLGVAGALDVRREIILNSPNIQYLNSQPLKQILKEKLNPYSVKLEHDVNCFLLAEKEFGLAKNFKNVVYITIGMGVGGAWMVDGKIQAGAHGAAGEVGHMIIEASQQLDFEDLTANNFVKGKIGVSAAEAERIARAGDRKA